MDLICVPKWKTNKKWVWQSNQFIQLMLQILNFLKPLPLYYFHKADPNSGWSIGADNSLSLIGVEIIANYM